MSWAWKLSQPRDFPSTQKKRQTITIVRLNLCSIVKHVD